jgi:hypothetical protein
MEMKKETQWKIKPQPVRPTLIRPAPGLVDQAEG